jgi:hypothetical protein
MPGSIFTRRSTSCSLVSLPKEKRTVPVRTQDGTSNAASTWLGSVAPAAQALPAEAATP